MRRHARATIPHRQSRCGRHGGRLGTDPEHAITTGWGPGSPIGRFGGGDVCNWAAWLSVDAQDELRADSTCQKGCMSYDLKAKGGDVGRSRNAWAACDISDRERSLHRTRSSLGERTRPLAHYSIMRASVLPYIPTRVDRAARGGGRSGGVRPTVMFLPHQVPSPTAIIRFPRARPPE